LPVGALLVRRARREAARRLEVLRTGRLIQGTVIGVRASIGLAIAFGHLDTRVRARFVLPDGRGVDAAFSTPLAVGVAAGAPIQGVVSEEHGVLFPGQFGARFNLGP